MRKIGAVLFALVALVAFSSLPAAAQYVQQPNIPITQPASWTPTDQSGAALTFTSVSATWQRIGNYIYASFTLAFPTNASGAAPVLGGLPVVAAMTSYGAVLAPLQNNAAVAVNSFGSVVPGNTLVVLTNASGVTITNAQLSAANLSGLIIYPVN